MRLTWVVAVCITASVVKAEKIKVAYLGLAEGESAAFSERFGEQIRDRLAVIEQVHLIDFLETQRLKERIRFEYFPTVSRDLVQKLKRFSGDSTLVVWGRVDELSIEPERRRLFGARAVASLKLVLTMYSLSFREYVFIGTAVSDTTHVLPPVFFQRVDKVSHIPAVERTEIMRELASAAARKAVHLVTAVVRSELAREEPIVIEEVPDTQLEERKEPTLEDLFEIPSMEAPSVEQEQEAGERRETAPEPPEAPVDSPPGSDETQQRNEIGG